MRSELSAAFEDLASGLRKHHVWRALAVEEIGDQHRRTTLGPLWLLLNYLIFAGTFIFIIHRGDTSGTHYAIYVATGLLVWFFLMEGITTGVTLFVREESLIKGTTLPLSVYVFRAVLQTATRSAYALAGCALILVVSGASVTPVWAWSIPGIVIILAVAPAVIICLAFLGVFFPDSQFLISNLMRVGMFVTPVFWTDPGNDVVRATFYHYNPFAWFLDVVRYPIVANEVPVPQLMLCLGIGALAWGCALVLLGNLRHKVAMII